MDFLATMHSHMRHLIFTLGVLSFVFSLFTFLRKAQPAKWEKILVKTYVYVLTLQFLLGLIQLLYRWSDYGDMLRVRLEHGFIMLVAVGIGHWGLKFVRKGGAMGTRNTMLVVAATIILIVLGILILPNGRALLALE